MSIGYLLEVLGVVSLVTFVLSLVAVPWLVGRLHAKYFLPGWRKSETVGLRHPLVTSVLHVLRNLAGIFLFFAGLAMLVLPGQGVLTMFIALCLLDFPGKDVLFQRLTRYERMQKLLNWMRVKQGKRLFVFPNNDGKG